MDTELEVSGDTNDQTASPAVDTTETSVVADINLDANSPSSSEQDAPDTGTPSEPKTLQEAIERSLQADTPEKSDAATTATEQDKGQDRDKTSTEPVEGDGSDPDHADPTDAELAELKPRAAKRVQQLLSQRNSARREAEEVRPDAESFRQIREYMQANSLVDNEVAELFQLGADMKSGDPARLSKVLERVLPVVQSLLEATGRAVPTDLRSRVEQGELTEDAAKQFGQERYGRAYAEDRARRAQDSVSARDTAAVQQAIHGTVGQWQQQMRAKDPDFDIKVEAMTREGKVLIAEHGLPRSPQEATEYAQYAYEKVSREYARLRPAPKATRPTPSASGAAPSGAIRNTPTSLEQVIQGVLAQHRA